MDALLYEHLLRDIYDCERYGARGEANADVYRKMEHAVNVYNAQKKAIQNNEVPPRRNSLEDIEFEMHVEIVKVSNNVCKALKKQLKSTHLKPKAEIIESLIEKLEPRNIDKKILDEVIDKATDIINKK